MVKSIYRCFLCNLTAFRSEVAIIAPHLKSTDRLRISCVTEKLKKRLPSITPKSL